MSKRVTGNNIQPIFLLSCTIDPRTTYNLVQIKHFLNTVFSIILFGIPKDCMNSLTAFSFRFVEVCMTFLWTPGVKALILPNSSNNSGRLMESSEVNDTEAAIRRCSVKKVFLKNHFFTSFFLIFFTCME